MTGKEKSRKRGWPRRAVSFPPARRLESKGWEWGGRLTRRGAKFELFY